jgi:hypothetical protein
MDINYFLSFKHNNLCKDLDNLTLLKFNNFFGNTKKKTIANSNLHILKNQELQNKKNNLSNKVNSILNKLSDSNINILVDEFIENINYLSSDEYNDLLKTFYNKILSEPIFMNIYLNFFKTITYIYNNIFNYDISYFVTLIEDNFKQDNSSKEEIMLTNMQLIVNMVNEKMLSEKIYNDCEDIILNKSDLIDVYNWFNLRYKNLSQSQIDKIKHLLIGINKLSREYILLNNLINQPININSTKDINYTKEKVNTFDLECENIIDEYILMNNTEDIKYFIETRCLDAVNKNVLCKIIIEKYFSENNTSKELTLLIKILINSQHLFKNNISKGYYLFYELWNDKSIDYNNPKEKMNYLLSFFKSIGLKNID